MSIEQVEVLVPVPILEKFSYLLPDQFKEKPPMPGSRVIVPFGNRDLSGVVWNVGKNNAPKGRKLKYLIEVLDSKPLLDKESLLLADWASRYYHYPLGEVISYFFPPSIRKGKEAKFAEVKFLELTSKGEFLNVEDLSKAPNQKKLIELIKEKKDLSQKAATAYGVNTSSINALIDKGFISRYMRELSPYKKVETPNRNRTRKKLNEEQKFAVDSIIKSENKNKVFLLNGITGSGKTEVYIRAIQEVINKGKQALILIPEIGLAPQAEERFKKYFGERVLSFHSAKNDREKIDAWLGASKGLIDIIIGTRSSVFMPMKDIGIIVIDEEHDLSYKQADRFRYSARDIALYRAKIKKIPVVLASATPSLETLNNSLQGKYEMLNLTKRATGASLPRYIPVDLRGKELKEGFSNELIERSEEELKKGNQILIFLNRRGYAPSLICKTCGWLSNCDRCDALMTLHKRPPKLQCHHCESQKDKPKVCPSCQSDDFLSYGYGTERVEEFLTQRFSKFPVLRIDSDSTKKKESMNEYIDSINLGKPMVLLGTQLLAKGHHFPEVTLVGILDADSGLYSADFRGSERVAQLMTQVAGRAGRDKKPGKVLLQSYSPDHPQIEELINGSYESFAKNLLKERKSVKSPPFAFQAKIQAESANSYISRDFIKNLINNLKKSKAFPKDIRVVGPLPAIMEKKSGVYRWELNTLSSSRKSLHQFLDLVQASLYSPKTSKKVRWSIDVDPLSSI
ncbi:MAG TPA: primosomal protein N' [SAR86 cluster bacterium]|nr:primosomal protein N' [SAR86 cluster bacterium]